jgi:membrane protein
LSTPDLASPARLSVAGLLQTLRDWPWFETLRTLRQRFREDRLGLTAGSLTFTTLISLVPLVTVMLAVFAAFPMFASFQSALEQFFLTSLVPESIARPVLKALTDFALKAKELGGIGALLLGASALAMMLTIDRSLNAIWRVRRPRPIAQRVLVYWAALTLGPLALGVSLSASSYALSVSKGLVGALPGGISLFLGVLEFGLTALAMSALLHYVPNTWVRWRHAVAGGLFVAAAFEVAKAALGWYVKAVPGISVIYGTFATLPILLLWIYLGWVIVLLGAVIAAYAPSLQSRALRRRPSAGDSFELALALLHELDGARQTPQRGLSTIELAQRLRVDHLQVDPALDGLMALDWVARLEEDGAGRHVLLCDPELTPAAPLIDSLLMRSHAATAAFRERAGFERMTLADLIR